MLVIFFRNMYLCSSSLIQLNYSKIKIYFKVWIIAIKLSIPQEMLWQNILHKFLQFLCAMKKTKQKWYRYKLWRIGPYLLFIRRACIPSENSTSNFIPKTSATIHTYIRYKEIENWLKYFWHSLFFYKMNTDNDALLKFWFHLVV